MIKTTIGNITGITGFDDAEIIELEEEQDTSEKENKNDCEQNKIKI